MSDTIVLFTVLDGGVANAVIGRESSNEKLAKESLYTIYGFGDALLEVISKDACDGLNVSRVCVCLLV